MVIVRMAGVNYYEIVRGNDRFYVASKKSMIWLHNHYNKPGNFDKYFSELSKIDKLQDQL